MFVNGDTVMEIKCQSCGNYYKDLLLSCPTCDPSSPKKDNIRAAPLPQTTKVTKSLPITGYINNNLIPGEKILYQTRLTKMVYKIPLIIALVSFALFLVVPPSCHMMI